MRTTAFFLLALSVGAAIVTCSTRTDQHDATKETVQSALEQVRLDPGLRLLANLDTDVRGYRIPAGNRWLAVLSNCGGCARTSTPDPIVEDWSDRETVLLLVGDTRVPEAANMDDLPDHVFLMMDPKQEYLFPASYAAAPFVLLLDPSGRVLRRRQGNPIGGLKW
jgi:hypothetical protein